MPAGDTKEGVLRALTALLERERVPYALICGVAVQLLTEEPRTTRDIDIALRTFADMPNAALIRAGSSISAGMPIATTGLRRTWAQRGSEHLSSSQRMKPASRKPWNGRGPSMSAACNSGW